MTGIDPAVFQIGPRITAQILGQPFTQYRPVGPTNPITTPLATIPAWITPDAQLMGKGAFKREKPDERYAGLDPALTQVGDYLIGSVLPGQPARTFFIASQDVPDAIRLVECNDVLTFYNPGTGTGGYAGDNAGYGTVKLTAWPASRITKSRGETAVENLPEDVRSPWFEVMLPAISSVNIGFTDVVIDQNGSQYSVSSAEKTALGWRLLIWLTTT